MTCKTCNAENAENAVICSNCGTPLNQEQPAYIPTPPPAQYYAPQQNMPPQNAAPYYAPPQEQPVVRKEIPEENKPLSPWAYFGLQLLFAIPVVGFIFLIIYSCSGANINRRNFARSYWCSLLVSVIVTVLLIVAAVAFGFGMESIASVLSSL